MIVANYTETWIFCHPDYDFDCEVEEGNLPWYTHENAEQDCFLDLSMSETLSLIAQKYDWVLSQTIYTLHERSIKRLRFQSSGRILISNPIQSKWSPGDLVSTWLMLPIIYGGHRIWFFWQYKQFFVHIEVNLNSPLRAPLQIFQHNKKLNWILMRSTAYLDIVKNWIIKLKFISSPRSGALQHDQCNSG